MLEGKTVVLGVCGGIAAYKAVEVASRLKKLKAEVIVIMTGNAAKFVTPLTFRSITHNPVVTDMFEDPDYWDIKHISLASRADLILIAPATANIIGKIASGIADDMLTTTVIASKAPVLFAPAMNYNMYANPIVQENIARLIKLGYHFMEPGTGQMAEGGSGKGRLPEPVEIVENVVSLLSIKQDMRGIKVLITAGPTREALDPVRYITNRSSGRMGYAIAFEAAARGASVKLVSGPVNIDRPAGVEIIDVNTADEMFHKTSECHKDCDIAIFTAAVADYRPKTISGEKIKKTGGEMNLQLVPNPDIAAEMGKVKGGRIHVGFSAETGDLLKNANAKMKAKNFDIVVANDVTAEGAGFETETNIVSIIKRDGSVRNLPLMKKSEVAGEILDEAVKMINGGCINGS